MNIRRKLLVALGACALSAPLVTFAQGFPSKPLRLIVRAPPGGTDDLIARLISPAIGKVLGQQVIVDYRPGAGGLVAWEYVAKQPPDGYTLSLAASGLAAVKSLRQETPVDPFRDFGWVSQVTSFMLVLVVHPSLPVRTLKELIALARSRPGQLSYGSSGVGATPHLAAEYFKAMAKVQIDHVPYKGAGPMYLDLIGGRIEMGAAVVGSAMPLIRSGKIRGLGVSGAKRSPQLPEVPTIAEAGLTGYEFEPFYAIVVAIRTPREIMGALSEAIAKAMSPPEFREQFFRIVGSEVLFNTPEQMLQVAKKEAELIDKIVRAANIKPE
ncbi:MAG: tripartite tricarboxylate transporter substrate binding protein [Betaproteobacteria bacterium]|nr:MAG: tripartite tricarboxylate transporter substrate binding protein [Betaproteobacteria bacterium]